jgi:hypothetical protein
VTAVCFGLSWVIAMYGMRKLRKVQKVRMWGEGVDKSLASYRSSSKIGGRGNWNNEALEQHAQRMGKLKGGGHQGRVLWPVMDGLGVHRLENDHHAAHQQHRRPNPVDGTTGSPMTAHESAGSLEDQMLTDAQAETSLMTKQQKKQSI